MKIQNVLRNILLEEEKESRFDKQYKQFVLPSEKHPKGIIPFDLYKTFIFADPQSKYPENFDIEGASVDDVRNNVKIGPNVAWLVKHFLSTNESDLKRFDDTLSISDYKERSQKFKSAVKTYREFYLEDLFKLTDILEKFDKIKQYLPSDKRNVLNLRPNELFDLYLALPQNVIDKLNKNKVSSIAREERKSDRFAHPGGEIIFRGPNYTVIKIEGDGVEQRNAAEWYGGYYAFAEGESRWCTSPKNSSHFKTYIVQGPLYVIMANDDKGLVGRKTGLPQERYQFHFGNHLQLMDRMDNPIPTELLTHGALSEVKDLFKDEFIKRLEDRKSGNKIKIELGSIGDSYGAILSLYGFDVLFDVIPKDLQMLYVTNTTKNVYELDFPESLGKLTNIVSLGLSNCVKTLPNSICNMKELTFLVLDKNENIQNIPECLANLENLQMLNLRESNPSLVIPTKLAELFHRQVDGFYTKN